MTKNDTKPHKSDRVIRYNDTFFILYIYWFTNLQFALPDFSASSASFTQLSQYSTHPIFGLPKLSFINQRNSPGPACAAHLEGWEIIPPKDFPDFDIFVGASWSKVCVFSAKNFWRFLFPGLRVLNTGWFWWMTKLDFMCSVSHSFFWVFGRTAKISPRATVTKEINLDQIPEFLCGFWIKLLLQGKVLNTI